VKTDDLIDRLATDLRPVHPGALGRLLACCLLPGLILSAALILFGHGLRPDLMQAIATPAFWVKSIYPLVLALIGLSALMIVARPGGVPRSAGLVSILVYLALAALGLWQLHQSSPGDYPSLIFGISYWLCPFIILAAAIPVYAAIVLFLRRAAPTRICLTGFVAGMTAGAVGAWTYSWGCIENGLPFVAIWYTSGIVLSGLLGMLPARRLLNW
jgi:hypothetical protein